MTAHVRQYRPVENRFWSELAMPADEPDNIVAPMNGGFSGLEKYMRGSLLLIVSSVLVLDVSSADAQARVIKDGSGSVHAPYAVAQRRRGRLRERIRSRSRQDERQLEETEQKTPQQRYPGALTPPPVPPAMPLRRSARPISSPPVATATPDRQSLETSLILAEAELDRQLDASSSADAYRKYFRVGRLRALLLEEPGTSLSEDSRRQLQQILDVYDRTRIDPSQRWVSRLSGFQKTHAGLARLLDPTETEDPSPVQVGVEDNPSPLLRQPAHTGEPRPTQVLPSVRDSY